MKTLSSLNTFAALVLLFGSTLALLPVPTLAFAEPTFGIKGSTPVFFDRSSDDEVFPRSEDREPKRTRWVVATAYSSDPWQTDSTPCIPAMWTFDMCAEYEQFGTDNTIAANFLPLGTQVKFPELFGDKIFVVRDRMNARYNGASRIDFWISSLTPTDREIVREAKAKAVAFGVKRLEMEVF